METLGCVSFRPSRNQVVLLGSLEKQIVWSLAIESAFLQADGLRREVFRRAPVAGAPKGAHRRWKLWAPACG